MLQLKDFFFLNVALCGGGVVLSFLCLVFALACGVYNLFEIAHSRCVIMGS